MTKDERIAELEAEVKRLSRQNDELVTQLLAMDELLRRIEEAEAI